MLKLSWSKALRSGWKLCAVSRTSETLEVVCHELSASEFSEGDFLVSCTKAIFSMGPERQGYVIMKVLSAGSRAQQKPGRALGCDVRKRAAAGWASTAARSTKIR